VKLRRGLLRAWLFVAALSSVGWWIFVVWWSLLTEWPQRDAWIDVTLIGIGPWLLTAIGFGIRWIVSGFRSRPST
jgi:hypothetical protein